MSLLIAYFSYGAGMYIGLALNHPTSFIEADTASLIRGLLIGFIFWPIGLIIKIIQILEEE